MSRLSFAHNQKAAVKVITVKQRQFSNIFTEEGHLFHGRLSELKKNLNFSLFFWASSSQMLLAQGHFLLV